MRERGPQRVGPDHLDVGVELTEPRGECGPPSIVMVERTGWRYGVDGLPYVAGFSGATVLALAGAAGAAGEAAAAGRGRRSGWWTVGAPGAAVAAGVPAGLGWRYVLHGKLTLRDRVVDAVAWRGDETVVDLGCGRGLLAVGAARRTVGPIHGVDLFIAKDLSGNTPDRLRLNLRRAGVDDRVVVHRRDIRDTGLPDAGVDVVLSTLCLHNIADRAERRRALHEVVRIVRPAGTVVITDLAHVDDEYASVLRDAGYRVSRRGKVPGSFPCQRMLVATAPPPRPTAPHRGTERRPDQVGG